MLPPPHHSAQYNTALPPSLKIRSVEKYGESQWSLTAKINCEVEGEIKPYFFKCVHGSEAKTQLEGESMGMTELAKHIPHAVPQVLASAGFDKDSQYLLIEFLDMREETPDPAKLAEVMATLHKSSMQPGGRYGFPVPTFDGTIRQNTTWDPSWSAFCAKLIVGISEADRRVNGRWPELEFVLNRAVQLVIPRLLDCLQIDPCLIHGDLWEGNVGVNPKTEDVYLFDAAAYYAHHEFEVGSWHLERRRYLHDEPFLKEYLHRMGPSEPVAEFLDRGRLYSVKHTLINSSLGLGLENRQRSVMTPVVESVYIDKSRAFDDLLSLNQKFAPGEDIAGLEGTREPNLAAAEGAKKHPS